MGCHARLQGIFPTQGSNPRLQRLLYCRQILYHWGTREAPRVPWLGIKCNRAYGNATLYWVLCPRQAQGKVSGLDATHQWPMYLACTDTWSLLSYPDRWRHSCRGLSGTHWCPSHNEVLHSPSDTHSGRHHLCSHIFLHAHKDCCWLEDTSTHNQDQSTRWSVHKCGLQKWVRLVALGPVL